MPAAGRQAVRHVACNIENMLFPLRVLPLNSKCMANHIIDSDMSLCGTWIAPAAFIKRGRTSSSSSSFPLVPLPPPSSSSSLLSSSALWIGAFCSLLLQRLATTFISLLLFAQFMDSTLDSIELWLQLQPAAASFHCCVQYTRCTHAHTHIQRDRQTYNRKTCSQLAIPCNYALDWYFIALLVENLEVFIDLKCWELLGIDKLKTLTVKIHIYFAL